MTLQNTTADKINSLHQEIEAALNKSLKNAIEIGRLLSQAKAEIPHGQFTGWLSENCTFSGRTARRYMKLFDNRDKIGSAEGIQEAYTLLQEPKTDRLSNFEEAEVVNSEIDEAFHLLFDTVWHLWWSPACLVNEEEWEFLCYLSDIYKKGRKPSGYEENTIKKQLNYKNEDMPDSMLAWGWIFKVGIRILLRVEDYEPGNEEGVKKVREEYKHVFEKLGWEKDFEEYFIQDLVNRRYERACRDIDALVAIREHFLTNVCH
jgi:hypothetical protein